MPASNLSSPAATTAATPETSAPAAQALTPSTEQPVTPATIQKTANTGVAQHAAQPRRVIDQTAAPHYNTTDAS
ncbi:hypothetical protein [Deinococcus xinjiangensis]|uniref:hypothetical protein n=1 Tax=Deinococcus xinjiangensis TaxID=457454 RepID=UPI003365757B